jgi:hypothetical protein
MTASIIEKNLSLFKSVCEHVDVIATIIEYLKHFGARFMFDSKHGNIIFTIAIEKIY